MSDDHFDDLLAIMPPDFTDPIIIPGPILQVNSFCGSFPHFTCKNSFRPKKCRASNAGSNVRSKVLPASIRAGAPTGNRDYKCYCAEQSVPAIFFSCLFLTSSH
ncbi:MAG: hypothetical protein AMJ65_14690 [Phycisphaerae bacterium SG8_4]|nr:MAG: hypothetical protein AMJ65_14690 [Phycisphaerae bacterium SG8_4]